VRTAVRIHPILSAVIVVSALLAHASASAAKAPSPSAKGTSHRQRVIIMVWDGLRPDAISPVDTPNLFALRQQGVGFADNHATYPTFTMMNGASFATGSFPKSTGFYGNYFWTPPQAGATQTIPVGRSAVNGNQNYQDPVFTEDYAVLATLDDYYGRQLLMVKSLFKTAQDAGLKTLALGKSGSAYIQDIGRGGYFVDENTVLPKSLAIELQSAGFALPRNTSFAYAKDDVVLGASNGDPTARAGALNFMLPDGTAAHDATDTTQGAPEDAANKYMLGLFTQYILPKKLPDLSVIWFRTPDNSEHAYGPGSSNYRKALASQDARLGELQAALKREGLDRTTNILVVSDHGHSTVSGSTRLFPLRAIVPSTSVSSGITNATLGDPDPVNGYSVSGDVRVADMLTLAGFKAYDGNGCLTSPQYGIKADGTSVYPVAVDQSGSLCGKAGTKYQAISAGLATPVASFKVPATLPPNGIVIAPNGGSDYFYVPDHDIETISRLVRFLQGREEYGAIFVDSRYGSLPGTLPMSAAFLENLARRDRGQPDIMASFDWDATQLISGVQGTEYESLNANRGMHGSFSPIDVHNTLVAKGPAFRSGITIASPTGNVDVAPTVAHLFGLAMPQADGRVLNEALVKPASRSALSYKTSVVNPTLPARSLAFKAPTDPSGATIDSGLIGNYSINLVVKDLAVDGKTYRYFDYAQAVRD
jgi:predicted AlkP superfamily pyrophosphatase or phosphodiesterase